MKEIILKNKKNGMLVLILTSLVYLASIVGLIFGGMILDKGGSPVLFIASMIYVCIGWLPWCGLRVLKPQEALVLTLFGKYIGTIKGDGFYAVNPFCSSVNPAAKTELNQSGDVKKIPTVTAGTAASSAELVSKKISLSFNTLGFS